MKLHWSPRSPFVRKVMVAAHELGLADRLDRVRTVVAMLKPARDLLHENPARQDPDAGDWRTARSSTTASSSSNTSTAWPAGG